jgi:hypothetical protein
MKGTIVLCLEQLVCSKFGEESWQKIRTESGVPATNMFLPFEDVDDATVMKLIQALCATLHLSLSQAADAFGEYWVMTYSQELYQQYYQKNKTAKDFLLEMDAIHVMMTRTIQNAHPPRFTYDWKDEKTLIVHYASQRNLIDLAIGLIKGVGKFYQENLRVTKLGEDRIQVIFP